MREAVGWNGGLGGVLNVSMLVLATSAIALPLSALSVYKVDPMSSTTFGPVFRVGASGHPDETLDTWAEGAGGAQRPRPGSLRPARAEKCGWRRPPALPKIEIGGAAVVERLMRPLGVVEREIAGNPVAGIAWIAIVGQVDLLIFQAAPQALGKDVIQCPPLAIHTDLHARRFERLGDLRDW